MRTKKLETLEDFQRYEESLTKKRLEILKDLHNFNLLKKASLDFLEIELNRIHELMFIKFQE